MIGLAPTLISVCAVSCPSLRPAQLKSPSRPPCRSAGLTPVESSGMGPKGQEARGEGAGEGEAPGTRPRP